MYTCFVIIALHTKVVCCCMLYFLENYLWIDLYHPVHANLICRSIRNFAILAPYTKLVYCYLLKTYWTAVLNYPVVADVMIKNLRNFAYVFWNSSSSYKSRLLFCALPTWKQWRVVLYHPVQENLINGSLWNFEILATCVKIDCCYLL